MSYVQSFADLRADNLLLNRHVNIDCVSNFFTRPAWKNTVKNTVWMRFFLFSVFVS